MFPEHSIGNYIVIHDYTDDFFSMMSEVISQIQSWDWGSFPDKEGLILCLNKVAELARMNTVIYEHQYKNYRLEYDNGSSGGIPHFTLTLRIDAWDFSPQEIAQWSEERLPYTFTQPANCLFENYVYEQVTMPRIEYWNDFYSCTYRVTYNRNTQSWDELDYPESWSYRESDNDKRYYYSLNGRVRSEYFADTFVDMYWSGFNYSSQPTPPEPQPIPGREDAFSGLYPSKSRGGHGSYDDSTDSIELDTTPDIDIQDLGFFSIYKLTQQNMKDLADMLYLRYLDPDLPLTGEQVSAKDMFDLFKYALQNIYTMLYKPLSNVVSIAYVPIEIPDSDCVNVPMVLGSIKSDNFYLNKLKKQIYDFDFGEIDVREYWGGFLDYNPNTEISIFLPYIGFQSLTLNDIMDARVHLVYRIDLLSGQTIAFLEVKKPQNLENGSIEINTVLYQWATNIKSEIPITALDYSNQRQALATIASVIAPIVGGVSNVGSIASSAVSGVSSTASQIATSPLPNPTPHGTSLSNGNGLLGIQEAFLMIHRPIQSLDEQYPSEVGFVCNVTKTLSEMSGFVQIANPHFNHVVATSEELQMLSESLKEGIIL